MFEVKVLAASGWVYTYKVDAKSVENESHAADYAKIQHIARVVTGNLSPSEVFKNIHKVVSV